eukprot:gnl/MRDRNA2_/MRDRNA2_75106_c0_seq3.p1 gnl/MRDRNA2_/MRDRNA2_75106_c0~~gnl/MRDRNA2_/MRDRNA2_75106_c0_seq3.p1  ORF type:complete len:266 (+),score=53.52 gnl/MRDRNA2_/MRDRNA2_75106_c0_seq3:169-966(+)
MPGKWIPYAQAAAKKLTNPPLTAEVKAPRVDPAPKPVVTTSPTVGTGRLQVSKKPVISTADSSLQKPAAPKPAPAATTAPKPAPTTSPTVGTGPLQVSKRPVSPTADSSPAKKRWIPYSQAAAKKGSAVSSSEDRAATSSAGTITRAPTSASPLNLAKASSAVQQNGGLSKVKQEAARPPSKPSPASQSSQVKTVHVKTAELDSSEIRKIPSFEEVADSICSLSERLEDPEAKKSLASVFASKLPEDTILTLIEVLSDTYDSMHK